MSDIKRSVCFYSLQDQYVRGKMTLEDITRFVKQDLAAEMEFIPDQMLKGSPNPTKETLRNWDSMIEKYNIIPVCCGPYINDKLYKNRMLTVKEGADNLIQGIKLASRLGFKMVKLVSTTRVGIVEAALPYAEKYGVIITEEIHGGMSFDIPCVQDFLELIHRVNSPYLGFTIDTGIFCRRHPRVSTNYFRSVGLNNEYLIQYIDDIFANGSYPGKYFADHSGSMEALMDKCSTELEQNYVIYSTGYDNSDLKILDEHMPYIKHIHGKLYEITEEDKEYSIPYEEIIKYLHDKNFDGYISTEYEGNRFTKFGEEVKEIEQVTKHQKLLKRYIEGLAD